MHPSLRQAELRLYQDAQFAADLLVHAETCGQLEVLTVKADEPLRVTVNIGVPNFETLNLIAMSV